MNGRYILTGGPGSGKTSVLVELEKLGFSCVPESARRIIQARLSKGLSPRPAPELFAREILAADIAEYHQLRTHPGPVFFDRGVVDALGMLFNCGGISTDEVDVYLRLDHFNNLVFIFAPWAEIYEKDSERDQTFAEAVTVYKDVYKWYSDLGFSIMEMPNDSPANRAEYIIGRTTE